jgi:hypothetical protein
MALIPPSPALLGCDTKISFFSPLRFVESNASRRRVNNNNIDRNRRQDARFPHLMSESNYDEEKLSQGNGRRH